MKRPALASEDVEALFALIYMMRDTPVQTRQAAAGLRAQRGHLGVWPVDVTSSASTAARQSTLNEDNLGAQVKALKKALARWFAIGELPPSLAPTLIQFMLMTARAETFEKAFLAAFCHHFGDEYAEGYSVVVERAVGLGVYPLSMVADPEEPVAGEPSAGRPQSLFDDFSLEAASSAPIEITEPDTVAEPALTEAAGLPDQFGREADGAEAAGVNERAADAVDDAQDQAVRTNRLQERRRQPGLPLALDSRLSRKAKGRPGPNPATIARRRFWGLFDSLRR